MRRFLVAAVVLAGLAAGCGSDDADSATPATEASSGSTVESSTSPAATDAPAPAATDAPDVSDAPDTTPAAQTDSVFGDVVAEYPTVGVPEEWLTWDADNCAFVTAPAPYDGEYVVQLRDNADADFTIGWTPSNTTADNLVLVNKTWESAAEASGVDYFLVDNANPEVEKALTAAADVATQKPDVVMSMNTLADLQPAIFEIYDEACIPSAAFSVPPTGLRPYIAGSWENAGQIDATEAIGAAVELGWEPESISVLFCISGAVGTAKGGPYDATLGYEAEAITLGVPAGSIERIDCSLGTGVSDAQTAQTSVRDWQTAHPDTEHVLMFAGPDAVGIGMYNAVVEAERQDTTLITGVGLTEPVRALLLEADPTFIGSIDFGLGLFGPYGIAISQDIFEGKPVPTRIVQEITFVTADTIRDVLAERGTDH